MMDFHCSTHGKTCLLRLTCTTNGPCDVLLIKSGFITTKAALAFILSHEIQKPASTATMRTRSQLASITPPPSPIPTGKGLRSAAVDDEILSEYLQKSLQIPDLTLPKSSFSASVHRLVPTEIDYRSIVSRERDSIDLLLRSAAEVGVFLIVGHGISAEESSSIAAEAECVFQNLQERETKVRRNGNREEFVWNRSEKEGMQGERDVIGNEKYRKFSQKMENVGRTLEVIAEELGRVFSENAAKRSGKRIHERESVLCLYRYSHENVLDQKPPSDSKKNCKSCDHALSLHLPVKQAEFCVQSERGPLSFDTGPDTIVVTAGELLEEWSLGEFKFVSGEMIFEPDIHESQASLFIELKCSPLTLNHELNNISKTISLVDQLFIVLIVAFLYKFVVFISSQFT